MERDQGGLCRPGLGKSMERLGVGSLLFEIEGKKRERDRMNEWMDKRKKEGRKNLKAAQVSKGLRKAPLSLSGNF